MIDVWAVVANGIWVLGLALALAGWSWARWAALDRTGSRWALDLGLLLLCLGLAATSRRLWERGAWGVLAAAWAVHGAKNWLSARTPTRGSTAQGARTDPGENG